jgi:hypothetical protein
VVKKWREITRAKFAKTGVQRSGLKEIREAL